MSSSRLIIPQQTYSFISCRLRLFDQFKRLGRGYRTVVSIECHGRRQQAKLFKRHGQLAMPILNDVPIGLETGLRKVHHLTPLVAEPSTTTRPSSLSPTGYSSDTSIKSTDLKGYFSNEESEDTYTTAPFEIWPLESEGDITPVKKFRHGRLFATDLVNAWCEAQQFYDMDRKKMKKTVAATRGTAYHKKKEKETAPVVREVKTITREDTEASRLIDQICKIEQLFQNGIAREIQVFGVMNGFYVSGRIDELVFTDCDHSTLLLRKLNGENTPEAQSPFDASKAQVYVSDLKSGKARRPRQKQDPATGAIVVENDRHHQQLMVYQYLLQNMASGSFDFDIYYGKIRKLDLDRAFNEEILAAISEDYRDWSPFKDITCLRDLIFVYENKIKLLEGRISAYAFIDFVLQTSWKNVESREFLFDVNMFQRILFDRLEFWSGNRLPRGVDIEESFKCRSCPFANNCLWRYQKSQKIHSNDGSALDIDNN